jgi:hypothetical protein
MNSDKFTMLDEAQKTEAVLNATFLADRLTDQYYVRLYNLDNFYVEVFFDDRTHTVEKFRAFEHTLFVLPYLEEVEIAV